MDSSNPQNSVKSVLSLLAYRLKVVSETPMLEAQVLVAHHMGRSRAWLVAHPDEFLTREQAAGVERCASRRQNGEPLPYLLGRWEFYGLELEISPQVLIPRPETELLVDIALEWLRRQPGARLAADIGCGSGCITLAITVNHPQASFLAADISFEALRLAARNITQHNLSQRVMCVQANLLPACSQRFDLICANLPYIPSATLAGLEVGRWEPKSALDGGPDGLDVIRRLLAQAPHALAPGGLLLLEIEAGQGPAASTLARSVFPGSDISLVRDLAGRDRLIRIQADPVNR